MEIINDRLKTYLHVYSSVSSIAGNIAGYDELFLRILVNVNRYSIPMYNGTIK